MLGHHQGQQGDSGHKECQDQWGSEECHYGSAFFRDPKGPEVNRAPEESRAFLDLRDNKATRATRSVRTNGVQRNARSRWQRWQVLDRQKL
ncbi:unnamed protein product, partial [Gadus morhua 'NCC']